MSFVVGADQAIIRPIDVVPGYVVPDGRPAREMSARLSQDGPAFPGPDLNHVWVQSDENNHAVMVLAALHSSSSSSDRVSMPIPADSFAAADGAGNLLFTGIGGVYDARHDGLHRITTGSLLAVGPTGWLAVECDNQYRCATVFIDRADGARHVVGAALSAHAPQGVISPDGKTAAVFNVGSTGTITLTLLDLTSGSQKPVDISIDQAVSEGTIVWSPDSRRLFAVAANGKPAVVNAHTARVSDFGTTLPTVKQLAIRNVPTR